LYCAPLSIQTKRFSSLYLAPFADSPLIKKYYRDTSSKKNVFERSFNTGSVIFLSYAAEEADADRIRGINADLLFMDEFQDCDWAAYPAIAETTSASEFAFHYFAGTSKSINNSLEHAWINGNMLEYCSKCQHCGKWVIPDNYETCLKICSGKEGPVCPHCGKPHDPTDGEWVAGRPDVKDWYSFHLPQFIFKANTQEKKWPDVYTKVNSGIYSKIKVANEVFGLAEDSAGRPLSIKECMSVCDPNWTSWCKATPRDYKGITTVVVGVDWSVTGSTASYTLVTVTGYDALGKMYWLYAERLQGIDILQQVARVKEIFYAFEANAIATDRGVGVLQCQLLQRDIGEDRVFPIQYVAAKTRIRWDNAGRFYATDRTMMLDQMVMRVKMGKDKIQCPAWGVSEAFWADALALFEEETLSGRRVYRKDADKPDDSIHSLTFALTGYQILLGDVSFERETQGHDF
jgi:hypothetical protein